MKNLAHVISKALEVAINETIIPDCTPAQTVKPMVVDKGAAKPTKLSLTFKSVFNVSIDIGKVTEEDWVVNH